MSIRTVLRQRREELGWSLRKAAQETGIPYGTLGQYETGHTQPTLERLEQWCTGLGVELALRGETSDLVSRISSAEDRLTSDEKRVILALVTLAEARRM